MRYVKVNLVKEEFLFWKPLKVITKGFDVFNLIKDFTKYKLPMNVIGSTSIDGAIEMSAKIQHFFENEKITT